MKLFLLEGRYAICRLAPDSPPPEWIAGRLVSVTRTPAELSVVCAEGAVPEGVRCERGWAAMGVGGPIPFGATGVLAALTSPLRDDGIGVFVLSTYDTDYLLVKEEDLARTRAALSAAGHSFPQGEDP